MYYFRQLFPKWHTVCDLIEQKTIESVLVDNYQFSFHYLLQINNPKLSQEKGLLVD